MVGWLGGVEGGEAGVSADRRGGGRGANDENRRPMRIIRKRLESVLMGKVKTVDRT